MSFLPNSNENPEVLKCLHQCSESLQIPSASQLAPGMQVLTYTTCNFTWTSKQSYTTIEYKLEEQLCTVDCLKSQMSFLNGKSNSGCFPTELIKIWCVQQYLVSSIFQVQYLPKAKARNSSTLVQGKRSEKTKFAVQDGQRYMNKKHPQYENTIEQTDNSKIRGS